MTCEARRQLLSNIEINLILYAKKFEVACLDWVYLLRRSKEQASSWVWLDFVSGCSCTQLNKTRKPIHEPAAYTLLLMTLNVSWYYLLIRTSHPRYRNFRDGQGKTIENCLRQQPPSLWNIGEILHFYHVPVLLCYPLASIILVKYFPSFFLLLFPLSLFFFDLAHAPNNPRTP